MNEDMWDQPLYNWTHEPIGWIRTTLIDGKIANILWQPNPPEPPKPSDYVTAYLWNKWDWWLPNA